MKKITFNESPRPQLVRENWTCLDGKWDFTFDYLGNGKEYNFHRGFKKEFDINVPFAYQTKASGINIDKRCDDVWYQRHINIDKKENKRYIIHLEGADYKTSVYLNGQLVGKDTGAYHRQSYDITNYIYGNDNLLVIHCHDDYSCEKPRGKQRWKDQSFECFYVDTTGIFKSVWLEEVNKVYVTSVKMTPSVKDKNVRCHFVLNDEFDGEIDSLVSFEGKEVLHVSNKVKGIEFDLTLTFDDELKLWDVFQGNLYDVKFDLSCGDSFSSYFGFREIYAKDGFIYLNGKKLYQKLVLDQGYYTNGHLTQENNKELYDDIVKMIELGFNGCRKHQKVEDERFIYYADILGYLMWSEMPSMYENTENSRQVFEREWLLAVKQQYNHPCIITWTPLNESWGIREIKTDKVQQEFADRIYKLTKEYDPERFVITNDGWEHTISDIITIHHYEQDGAKLHSYFDTKEKALADCWESHNRGAFANGYKYNGQPIMVTEFGGTAYEGATKEGDAWGYGVSVKNDEEYVNRLKGLFEALHSLEYSSGYCFTQVSDVQQEVNGLVFENREFKVDPKLIKDIQDERN